MTLPAHLDCTTEHHAKAPGGLCRDASCSEAVKLNTETGRFFVTLGHAGFNLPANNGSGFKTEGNAVRAMRRCLGVR